MSKPMLEIDERPGVVPSVELVIQDQVEPFVLEREHLSGVLDEVAAVFRKYVVFPSEHAADVLAIWVAHTYVFSSWFCTPYLAITSAEKQSGKTNLLDLLEWLCREALLTGQITPAGLYQRVEAIRPTLLVDEFDTAMTATGKARGQLQGIFNSGYKANGKVLQAGRSYSTYCPKAIAAIGELPDTIADRSIPIRLIRKLPGEAIARFYHSDVKAEADPLAHKLAGLRGHADPFRNGPHPLMPTGLSDREREIWEPLFAIAEFAGGSWPERIAAASVAHRRPADEDSAGTLLLRDLKTIRDRDRGVGDRISMARLVNAQRLLDAPEFHGALDARKLGAILRRYGIKAKTMKLSDGSTAKGYEWEWFEDAFIRYAR